MIQDLRLYTSEYTATGGEYSVPINILAFNPATDFLLVYANSVYVPESDYTLNAQSDQVIFNTALTAGDEVDMLVFVTNGVDIYTEEFGLPESRNEAILQNILGGNNTLLYPQSRIEVLLMALLKNGNIDASGNENVMAALNNVKENWESYDTGIVHIPNVQADGPVCGVIAYKYTNDYGAVLIISYHPMFPHPAYCRLFAGEWTTPYWL